MNKSILTIFTLFFSSLSFGQSNKIQVYIAISEECPISIAMVDDLKNLNSQFNNDVGFTLVFPMQTSDTLSAQQFLKEYEIVGYAIMVTNANKFCNNNGLTITPEAMVLSKEKEIIYRGRINNLYLSPGKKNHQSNKLDLRDAIFTAINNGIPKSIWPKAIGCFITYEE